ncbi:hypothetical protein N7540_007992 [Penicillium herquei]|nr:hypothetical protein N7540_007992 [Penicillium herquei]
MSKYFELAPPANNPPDSQAGPICLDDVSTSQKNSKNTVGENTGLPLHCLSSDSDPSLSDVPSDFELEYIRSVSLPSRENTPSCGTPIKNTISSTPKGSRSTRSKLPKTSRYFVQEPREPPSCLPFASINAPAFGLIQEQLAHDPFKLLIATIFLNKTRGGVALPVLFQVFDRYPTIDAMATADEHEFVTMIHCLGLQNQRAQKCISLAQTWLTNPPMKGKRYRKMHYPNKLDGRDLRPDECVDDEDPRSAWEIAHLAGVGAYSIDSWRIFCRDELRGLATDWKGSGATSPGFVPEWKSVLPFDKELRAYLTWMWLKEGWEWDRHTGDLNPASEELLNAAEIGGVAREENGNWVLETSPVRVVNGLHGDD